MKKIALLMVLMVLQTLAFIPSVAITMVEEEEVHYLNCFLTTGCSGTIEQRCTGTYVSSFNKSCNKNFGMCTVTVHTYLHGGFCSKCMKSLGSSHDHVEYHTNSNCFSPQWVCTYY